MVNKSKAFSATIEHATLLGPVIQRAFYFGAFYRAVIIIIVVVVVAA